MPKRTRNNNNNNNNNNNTINEGLTPIENGNDAIVIIIGHSEFKGDEGKLCYMKLPPEIKHNTLLIGNINTCCLMDLRPHAIEAKIMPAYANAHSLTYEEIKAISKREKEAQQQRTKITLYPIESRKKLKRFLKSEAIYSEDPEMFCEREWAFYDESALEFKREFVREGMILLLRLDGDTPYYEKLFESEMEDKPFTLKKSKFLRMLYKVYGLKNVLLLDYGCTSCEDISNEYMNHLHSRKFGGKKKKPQKRKLTRKLKPYYTT